MMKQSIYVIEDNILVREALVMLIEGEPDLEVCGVAETATEALEVLRDVSPDLVIADFSLPRMNGVEFLKRLRVLKPGQRAVILSGHAEPAYAELAFAVGAWDYILKGEPLAMMEKIRQALRGDMCASRSALTSAL